MLQNCQILSCLKIPRKDLKNFFFWLWWVFSAAHRLSLVVGSGLILVTHLVASLLSDRWELPGPGIEPVLLHSMRWTLNHWPTREAL